MNDKELLAELDRNMDTVFDSLYVLNSVVAAIVESLPKPSALQVVPALDVVLKEIQFEKNPLSDEHLMQLLTLRDAAARIAQVPLLGRET